MFSNIVGFPFEPVKLSLTVKDLLIPVTVAKNFYADLPNDTLVVLKNLGHTPMEEDPKQTLEVFKSFLIKK